MIQITTNNPKMKPVESIAMEESMCITPCSSKYKQKDACIWTKYILPFCLYLRSERVFMK